MMNLFTLFKNLCCLYIDTNFENKSKKVLTNAKQFAIIRNINKMVIRYKLNMKIEKFLKISLTSSKKFDIIIA